MSIDGVTNIPDSNILLCEFEIQSRYYVHLQIYIPGKSMNSQSSLNTTTAVF